MPDKKQTYKEINGTTRVGDFLRSIGRLGVLEKTLGVGLSLATGNVDEAIKKLLKSSDELTQGQREFALKLLESDIRENEEVTKRWVSDNMSDTWLSKNIRPMVLAFLMITLFIYIILDSSSSGINVAKEWISLLSTNLSIVVVAYFGGRSYEKTKKL
tara:strand:+ start:6319 stop:6792 length:474 start_codon:yes stop_codon:yes gene_type:complete